MSIWWIVVAIAVLYLALGHFGHLPLPSRYQRAKRLPPARTAVNPFRQDLPHHFWPEEWVKRADSQTYAHSDYRARLHVLREATEGREKFRDFKLKERMEKLYNDSPSSETRAAVAVMFENHLLPAYRVFTKSPVGDRNAQQNYDRILDIIAENLSTLEKGQAAAVEMEQLVTLRHLEAVRDALSPRKSDLDL